MAHFHKDNAAYDIPDDILPCDNGIHRCVQGIQRRGSSLRNGSQRRRNEHYCRICLRYALRRQRGIPVIRFRRRNCALRHRFDHHLRKPPCEPQARPLLRRLAWIT